MSGITSHLAGKCLRASRAFLLELLVWGAVVASCAHADNSTVIDLHDSAVIKGDEVFLNEIATIKGEHTEMVGQLKLQRAPLAGKTQLLKASYVLLKLRQAGFDTDRFEINGPSVVRLDTPGRTVPAAELSEVLLEEIREQLGDLRDRCEIQLVRPPSATHLPPCEVSWKVRLGSPVLLGGIPVKILAVNKETGDTEATVSSYVRIRRYEPVLVASREIPAGSLVMEADLEKQDLEVASKYQLRELFTEQDAVVGMKVKRFIALGEPMKRSALEKNKVIGYGDEIRIEVRRGALVVSAPGIARQAGCIGDRIRVRCLMAGRDLLARVTGRGIVLLE